MTPEGEGHLSDEVAAGGAPELWVGPAPLHLEPREVEGALVEVDGERHYRVANCDRLPPFLVTVVSSSDHWLFVASNGALTAGRRSPDEPLFPYTTDDRLYDSAESTGPKTLLRVEAGGTTSLWEPFSCRYEDIYRVSRSLSKSVHGDAIRFEEVNEDLGLCFSYTWVTGERFGFVRRASVASLREQPLTVDLLDGLQNLMPHGVGHRFQTELSTLADGYKRADLDAGTGLALIRLAAVPVDRAEPSEALRATTVWARGLEPLARLLTARQLEEFRRGGEVQQEAEARGQRGAYFVRARLELGGGERHDWELVADVAQDAADVSDLLARLRSGADLGPEIEQDVRRGRRELIRLVAAADGLQASEDEASQWRHFSNALFNAMRGGIPDRGYWISRAELASHIGRVNRDVARRQAMFAHSLPDQLSHAELLARVAERDDPDLVRIVSEYLPLTFSRRHGDPSRPWNVFSIDARDERGERVLRYEGNWRDVFQNWEALALSFPGYVESMVFKFLDASTADGHNPYRITHEGYDWERPDPQGVWSSIGYWGDHQVVYLLRLLELSRRFHPGGLERLLDRRLFTFADVPYRIHDYEALLSDAQQTIEFDAALDAAIAERLPRVGQDARALPDGAGGIRHASLAEKLLLVALARLVSFVPGGGIWMNTQRPEWNDANNALVGRGLSVVTLLHLRRFVDLARDLFATLGGHEVELAPELARLLREVAGALGQADPRTAAMDARERKALLDRLGGAGSEYRTRIYAGGFSAGSEAVGGAELVGFCELALRHLDETIRANRREDGLYHAYNLMELAGGGLEIRRLPEMLEGQVAALASGALSPAEALELLDALRASSLYRPDQGSYLLYPDRPAPDFLERNTLPPEDVARSRLLTSLVERGDGRIVVRDAAGAVHFNAAFRNARLLEQALAELAEETRGLALEETPLVLEIYERLFDHASFTGRSSSFAKYEGLGCVYWHMVAKLRLAVQETLLDASAAGAERTLLERLRAHHDEIREGLGVHSAPARHGAIPLDPYSHTPSFTGAQQPGMTGQVKEDLIARLGELGVRVEAGRLGFRSQLLPRAELLSQARGFSYLDAEGQERNLELPAGTLAFTFCQVPVVVHAEGPARIELTSADGGAATRQGLDLDEETSRSIFERSGDVVRLDVFYGLDGEKGRGRLFRFR